MQDRYAGDVGDFVKLGLLRALAPGRELGVVWYKIPNELHNNDGRHVSYLNQPEQYSGLDKQLFDHLATVVKNTRTIASLLPTLGTVTSFDDSIDLSRIPASKRRSERQAWLSNALEKISHCNLVFADPDNGIVDDANWRKGRAKFGKQMPLAEVAAFAESRCAIIYHHNTRRRGGHDAEVDYLLTQFNTPSMAVRAKAYSPRTFFIINPDRTIEKRTQEFCSKWQNLNVSLHKSSLKY